MITIAGLSAQRVEFELGGRAGNVVTTSNNTKIGKGWRLLAVNGEPVPLVAAEVKAVVEQARRKGKFTATFFGGKLAGGGGMNMEALGKAALAAQKLAAAKPVPVEMAKPVAKPAAPAPPVPKAPASATTALAALISAPAPPDAPLTATAVGGGPSKSEVQHAFISFDYDRDGELSFKDFVQMLVTLDEEYDFAEVGTDGFRRLVTQNFVTAGGRRANPDDEDDEDVNVTPAGFAKWYPEFMRQCDQRRIDEFEVTKAMPMKQHEQYLASRTLNLRNRNYPLLRSL